MSDTAPKIDAPSVESDLSGRLLGGFQLLRRLGRGAMAEVYLAEQLSLRRQVAVKVLKSHLASDATYVRRFHNEAQAAASLVHANIVQIHEVGCAEGIHYIAQEYVPGQNLREWMVRQGPPDLKSAVNILRQAAAALLKAAEHGIVHRDIKPENIMLSKQGDVKVADFGLARLTENGTVNLTQVGVTMGTPLYMSPEQVEGKPLDPRSDVYSLGVTSYHMLAGVPPFRGDTALSVAVQHLKTEPQRLEDMRPDLPAALCRIVHKMLMKAPGQRYQSARDLLRDLRAIHVEELADLWHDESGHDTAPFDADATARLEATQRLDAVMKTAAMQAVRAPRRGWWVAALVLALGGGCAAAWLAREPYLLADAAAAVARVPQQASASEQFSVALQVSLANPEVAERYWLSVQEYFPQERLWRLRAEQQLARVYLLQNNYVKALDLFDKLASLGEADKEFVAFGMVGKSIVLCLQDRHQESAEVMALLHPLRDRLVEYVDRQMLEMLGYAVQKNQTVLKQEEAADWAEWKRDHLSE